MRRDRPAVFDVFSIDDSEGDLQAAILLACWSAGFGTVNVAAALADAGLEPRRHYFVIFDELWRARGVGLAMISHTMSDLLSLATPEDWIKAKGFVERSGMVIFGGLPGAEMPLLTSVVGAGRQAIFAFRDLTAGNPKETEHIRGRLADCAPVFAFAGALLDLAVSAALMSGPERV